MYSKFIIVIISVVMSAFAGCISVEEKVCECSCPPCDYSYEISQGEQENPDSKPETIELNFVDMRNRCGFSGKILLNGINIGNIYGNSFIVNHNTYSLYESSENHVCIEADAKFCKYEGWKISSQCWDVNETSVQLAESGKMFNVSFSPRIPSGIEMTNFIRPEQMADFLGRISLTGRSENDFVRIYKMMSGEACTINIAERRVNDRWLLPNETLEERKPDCDDWATAFLSLLKKYDEDIKCHNVVLATHVTTLCRSGDKYTFYDRDLEVYTSIDSGNPVYQRNNEIRKLLINYFDEREVSPNKRYTVSAFDDKNFAEFGDDSEFSDWALKI